MQKQQKSKKVALFDFKNEQFYFVFILTCLPTGVFPKQSALIIFVQHKFFS